MVIHYEYLWRHEAAAGEERGLKRRPCAVVVAVPKHFGAIDVVVAPITHTEPTPPADGVEIPRRVKEQLGLDSSRSWVIVTDLNGFTWPGIDIYALPGAPSTYEYGFLPPALFEIIRAKVVAHAVQPTVRTED